jgi:ribosomal protein S18 acetylase RimI-like enzyme
MTRDHRIRTARAADAAALARLGEETFQETFVEGFAIPYPAEDLAAYVTRVYAPEAYAARIADPGQAVWLTGPAARPLAYAVAGSCTLPHPEARPEDGELKLLYVRREAQGLGLGPALLKTALSWLERAGPRRLWIGVWSGNTRAQQLYTRWGFSKAGEYDFPVGGWLDREWILRRNPGEQ